MSRSAEADPAGHAGRSRAPDIAPPLAPESAPQSASDGAYQPRYAVFPSPRPRIWSHGWDARGQPLDRKSTRLNSSHLGISYAVFCLKKKKKTKKSITN